MKVKKTARNFFLLVLSLVGFIFVVSTFLKVEAATADYQRCKAGDNCTIGEFLYDDNYNPIATASCTLTSRDPSGQVYLNSVAMTAATDGWYSYTLSTSGETEGLYRSQMCCTDTSGYLCIDKSFFIGPGFLSSKEVENSVWDAPTSSHSAGGSFGKNLQNPVLSASEIWGYTNRTLSGFGTLIADIWSYSTRSLTSFGTLIADIWNNSERTLSSSNLESGGELATKETVEKTAYSAVATVDNKVNKNVTDVLSFGKDSVIFDLTVTNPSSLITQAVSFTYYLPSEIKRENIIAIDKTLELNSGNLDNILNIEGEVNLYPSGEKSYKIEVADVWNIDPSEIESLRRQAKELFDPLKKTSLFGQGATLKSDIDVNLDKAINLGKDTLTPWSKIKSYRNAMIEVASAKAKIGDLKVLVAQAGSAKSLFGFIGGIQVTAVWGLILVFLAGFAFMIFYMRSMKLDGHSSKKNLEKESHENSLFNFFHQHKIKALVVSLIIGTGLLLGNAMAPDVNDKLVVAKKSIDSMKVTPTPTWSPLPLKKNTKEVLGESVNQVRVNVPRGASVNVLFEPLLGSKVIFSLSEATTAAMLQSTTDWAQIEIAGKKGWIAKEFILEAGQ